MPAEGYLVLSEYAGHVGAVNVRGHEPWVSEWSGESVVEKKRKSELRVGKKRDVEG